LTNQTETVQDLAPSDELPGQLSKAERGEHPIPMIYLKF